MAGFFGSKKPHSVLIKICSYWLSLLIVISPVTKNYHEMKQSFFNLEICLDKAYCLRVCCNLCISHLSLFGLQKIFELPLKMDFFCSAF